MSTSSTEESLPPASLGADAAPSEAPPPDEGAGVLSDSGSHQVGGWVTASPPRAAEVILRVLGFPGLVLRNRDLVTTSVKRELASRFRGTLLGWAWPLLTPLLFFAIYYFIFTKLLSFKFGEMPPDQEAAMGVYMFIGVLVWTAFGESVTRCTGVIVDNGNLIKKVAFPSEMLPLNLVLVNTITMLFGMVMFLVATLVTPLFGTPVWKIPEPATLSWVLALLPLQVLFTYGLGLTLATLQVYLRDTVHVVAVAVTVWMFGTPIFWAPQIVSDGKLGGFGWIVELNPIYHLVYGWRSVLMSRLPVDVTIPNAAGVLETRLFYPTPIESSVGVFALWALSSFLVGYTFFLLARRRFADEI